MMIISVLLLQMMMMILLMTTLTMSNILIHLKLCFSTGDEELDGEDADFRAVISAVCLLQGRLLPHSGCTGEV